MDQRAIRAGVGATIVALLLGAALGTYGGWTPVFSLASTLFGFWLVAVILGIALAYIYGYWFNSFLPGTVIIRGIIFGVLVWILMLILGGVSSFFKTATYPNPAGSTIFLTLLLHAAWGAVLGILYETR
jgi:hypothetical protein